MSMRPVDDLPPGGSLKITRGFREYLCEDAKGNLFTPPEREPPMQSIADWCTREAVLPVRITLRIHDAGDGIACETRKRVTFERVPMHVWFFDTPNPKEIGPRHMHDDAMKNLERMMPGALWARLYGVREGTASEIIKRRGFGKLPPIVNA